MLVVVLPLATIELAAPSSSLFKGTSFTLSSSEDNKDAQKIGKQAFLAPSKCISPESLEGPFTLNFSTRLQCTS